MTSKEKQIFDEKFVLEYSKWLKASRESSFSGEHIESIARVDVLCELATLFGYSADYVSHLRNIGIDRYYGLDMVKGA